MKVGEIIHKWRVMSERDLRSVAAEIGISAATLLRLEQGREIDGKTLVKIWVWLTADADSQSERVEI